MGASTHWYGVIIQQSFLQGSRSWRSLFFRQSFAPLPPPSSPGLWRNGRSSSPTGVFATGKAGLAHSESSLHKKDHRCSEQHPDCVDRRIHLSLLLILRRHQSAGKAEGRSARHLRRIERPCLLPKSLSKNLHLVNIKNSFSGHNIKYLQNKISFYAL